MQTIDLATWPRRKHFEIFNAFDYPHFGLCANVDVKVLHTLVKERHVSFTVAVVYVFARAANAIPEFRYRIRYQGNEAQVVEHAVIHPSATVMADNGLFSFCGFVYREAFSEFAALADERIALIRANPILEDEPGQDDLLFMTSIPWVSFTGLQHPIHMHPTDSVPRIAWGKFFPENDRLKMPLAVQAHHALMDGFHVGQYFMLVQELLDQPSEWLD